MGSHKPSTGSARKRGRPKGGGGGGGGGNAAGESEDRRKILEKEYERAASRVSLLLTEKKFAEAATFGTRLAVELTPPKEALVVLLAGIEAFKEGKKREWKPKPEDLATEVLESSQRTANFELPIATKKLVTDLLANELKKVAASGGS